MSGCMEEGSLGSPADNSLENEEATLVQKYTDFNVLSPESIREGIARITVENFIETTDIDIITNIDIATSNDDAFSQLPIITREGGLSFYLEDGFNGDVDIWVSLSNNSDFIPIVRTISILPKLSIFNLNVTDTVYILEDQGSVSVLNFTGDSVDEQYGVVEVSTLRGDLFEDAPKLSLDGTLTFKVIEDFYGEIKLSSNLASSKHQMVDTLIQVSQVNDKPVFSVGEVPVTSNVIGEVTIQDFVSSIDPGAFNEAGQSIIQYASTVSNGQLFEVIPSVSVNGTLSYKPKIGAIGTSIVNITAVDDGGVLNGGENSSINKEFTIHINPSIHNLNAVSLLEVNEDAGPFIDIDFAEMPMYVDGSFVSPGDIGINTDEKYLKNFTNIPTINDKGKLTFNAASDFYGEVYFDLYFLSNPELMHRTKIDINAVNDKPAFSIHSDIDASNASGANSISDYITDIIVGPSNESMQGIDTFKVTNDNPDLFEIQPSISNDGGIVFTPKAGMVGLAKVFVVAKDDGGTINGGINVSDEHSSTINIVSSLYNLKIPTSVTIPEDDGLTIIEDFADLSSQIISTDIAIEVDNPSNFKVLPVLSKTGDLKFEIAADYNGSEGLSFTLEDEPGVVTNTTITIRPVNDAPSFKVTTQTSSSNAGGPISIEGYVKEFVVGPENENSQKISGFSIVNDNSSLFIIQPSISPAGTLTYTPKIGMVGNANLQVVATDDGGVVDDGIDKSVVFNTSIEIIASVFNLQVPSEIVSNEDIGIDVFEGFVNFPAGLSVEDINISAVTRSDFDIEPFISLNGGLSFKMTNNYYGFQEIEFSLVREPGVTIKSLLEVMPVNDRPSFTLPSSHKQIKNSTAVTVVNFIENIVVGPNNESSQSILEYVVDVSDDSLFSESPLISNNGTLTYKPAHGKVGKAVISVTTQDNGGQDRSGIDISSIVSSEIIIFAPEISDLSVSQTGLYIEDQGLVIEENFLTWEKSIDFSDIQFTYISDVNFLNPPVIADGGSLSFEASADEYGDIVVKFNLIYNPSVVISRTFTIKPVNDKPSFEVQSLHTTPQDTGIVSVDSWTSNEYIGPANESTQVFTQYVLTNDNPSLFTIQPVINASGTLFYESKPGSFGQAHVTAILHDNGGVLDFGVDKSSPLTFTLTVDPSFQVFTVDIGLNPKELAFEWVYTRTPSYFLLYSRSDITEEFLPLDSNYDGLIDAEDRINSGSTSVNAVIRVYSSDYLNNVEFSLFAFDASNEFMSRSEPVTISGIDHNDLIGVIQNFTEHSKEKFGSAIALSADNEWLAIGAEDEKSSQGSYGNPNIFSGSVNHGAVFVLKKDGSKAYKNHSYLKSLYPDTAINFGSEISISADGTTLVVGNKGNSNCGTGVNPVINSAEVCNFSGAIEVYELVGNTWVHRSFIKDHFSSSYAYFGSKVSISADGNYISVGHINDLGAGLGINPVVSEAATSSGAVYVYNKDVNNDWQLYAYLKPTDTGRYLSFGSDISFDNSNNLFVSQGRVNESTYQASLSKFSMGSSIILESYIELDFDSSAQLPTALDVSGDGNTFVIGSLQRSSLYGGVLVAQYHIDSGSWSQEYIETNQKNALFGIDVQITNDGERIFVGAYSAGTVGSGSEAQYVYGSPTGMVSFYDLNLSGSYDLGGSFAAKYPEENSYFSQHIEIDLNGTTIIVSNSGEDSDGHGVNPDNSDTTIDSGSINIY